MALDPTREQAALQIQRARALTVRRLRDGRYQCFTDRDEAAHLQPADDPVTALEAAEAAIAAGEQRDAISKATRLFDALAQGTYGVWPRQVPDPDGGTRTAWVILDAAKAAVSQWPGLRAALVEIARLLNTPVQVAQP